jgi:hypothetical protein
VHLLERLRGEVPCPFHLLKGLLRLFLRHLHSCLGLQLYGGEVVAHRVVDLAGHPGALLGEGQLPRPLRVAAQLRVGRLQVFEHVFGPPPATPRLHHRRAEAQADHGQKCYQREPLDDEPAVLETDLAKAVTKRATRVAAA